MYRTMHAGRRWRLAIPLVGLAALACSDTAAPGPDTGTFSAEGLTPSGSPAAQESRVQGPRPMRIAGTVLLVSMETPPPAPCFLKAGTELAGRATHLGRFEGIGITCILTDLSTAVPDPNPPFTPAGPPPYVTARFTNPSWVLTAANGDELWLQSLEAVAVISGVDGSLRAEGIHSIIGGTGRFADATGELQTVGTNDDGLGPDDIRSEGWIAY